MKNNEESCISFAEKLKAIEAVAMPGLTFVGDMITGESWLYEGDGVWRKMEDGEEIEVVIESPLSQ